MRLPILALALAGGLAAAGGAAAQSLGNYEGVTVTAEVPTATSGNWQTTGNEGNELGSRHQRYLMRLKSLHEWLLKLKAQDGGQLNAEHTAKLQQQLDKLNRIYGKG